MGCHIVQMDCKDSYFYPQPAFLEKENKEDDYKQYERELKGYAKDLFIDLVEETINEEEKDTVCYKLLLTSLKLIEENRELYMAINKLSKQHENKYSPSLN